MPLTTVWLTTLQQLSPLERASFTPLCKHYQVQQVPSMEATLSRSNTKPQILR